MSNFRKFGTFKTPYGQLTTTGDGELLQRGLKSGDEIGGGTTTAGWNQFEVTVENTNRLRIKKGQVIAGLGNMKEASTGVPIQVCNRQFYIQNLFASTLSSTLGTQSGWYESIYTNNNGYITLPSPAEGKVVCVWIARNVCKVGSSLRISEGLPYLIVDEYNGLLDQATRPWGPDKCDMIDWYEIIDYMQSYISEWPILLRLTLQGLKRQKNYNCQRFRIADIKYESGAWKVYQYWQGTVTLPHPFVYRGLIEVTQDEYWNPDLTIPPWRDTSEIENLAEQENWEDLMSSNDKLYNNPTVYDWLVP